MQARCVSEDIQTGSISHVQVCTLWELLFSSARWLAHSISLYTGVFLAAGPGGGMLPLATEHRVGMAPQLAVNPMHPVLNAPAPGAAVNGVEKWRVPGVTGVLL